MPVTHCPSCGASLEVPAVVPGGAVACPYCGAEFTPQRPRAAGPARARRDDDYYEEDRRRPYRKRTDPVPIIVGVVFVIVLVGIGLFILLKSSKEKTVNAASPPMDETSTKNSVASYLLYSRIHQ